MKKITILLVTLFLISSASATIENLSVPSSVNLGETLTIDGKLSSVSAGTNLCSFRIYDDQNIFIFRLTDEIVSSEGVFSSSYKQITEPTFLRGDDYNVVIDCTGSNNASATFTVDQRRSPDFAFQKEVEYLFSQENTDLYFIGGFIVLLIILGGLLFIFVIRKSRGGI